MEFKKKCDFTPAEADYASQVMPLTTAARVGPLVFFVIFTAVAVTIIGFLAYAMNTFDTMMPVTGLVIVCAVYLVAVGVTVSAVRRTRVLSMPAVMIKGNTIAVRYQLGYYHIHISEIRSVTLAAPFGVPGAVPETVTAEGAGRIAVAASVAPPVVTPRGAVDSGVLTFTGPDRIITVPMPAAAEAAGAIAARLVSEGTGD